MIKTLRKNSFILILFISSAVILCTMLYTFKIGIDALNVHTPLVDAAMEIKFELVQSHLKFEEMMAGDASISLDDVKNNLNQSRWYANAMLNGGKLAGETFVPLSDSQLRSYITIVIQQLNTIEDLMNRRYENMRTSQPGSDIDQAFDLLLDECLGHADDVKVALKNAIDHESSWVKTSSIATLGLALSLFIFIVIQFRIHQAREYALKEKLIYISKTDALTKIANRRSFNVKFYLEWDNNKINMTPLSIALCDIDFFKHYNDTLGHQAGDECLQMISELMLSAARRDKDFVARYGGEEFIYLFPSTNSEEANAIIERLHQKLSLKKIPHPNSEISKYVTISAGISTVIPSDEINPDQFIAAADKALYLAKNEGRNRTVISKFGM